MITESAAVAEGLRWIGGNCRRGSRFVIIGSYAVTHTRSVKQFFINSWVMTCALVWLRSTDGLGWPAAVGQIQGTNQDQRILSPQLDCDSNSLPADAVRRVLASPAESVSH
jgi:hypothetical protein